MITKPDNHTECPRATHQVLGTRGRRLAFDERGQALVEFALVVLPLLLIAVGIFEFGLALSAQNDETHVASEVARYATVNENPGKSKGQTLQAWGKEQADQKAVREEGSLCISFPNGTSNIGDPVKVEFNDKWRPLKQTISVLKTTIVGTAVMRIEAPPSNYAEGCA